MYNTRVCIENIEKFRKRALWKQFRFLRLKTVKIERLKSSAPVIHLVGVFCCFSGGGLLH